MEFDEKLKEYAKAGYQVPTRDMIKNAEQIEKIKEKIKRIFNFKRSNNRCRRFERKSL